MAGVGVGLIGSGRHGVRYIKHLREDFPEHRLVGLARRDTAAAEQQASELSCRAFTDYAELIASADVDVVVVVVPPTLHHEIVMMAIEAGKPVLVEKPAAPTLEDGRALLGASRRHSVPVMVAQTLRYNGVVEAIRAARGSIGAIHAIRVSQRFEPSRPGWIDDPAIAGGGVTLHTGAHSFDLVRYLTGLEAQRVSCEMGSVGTARTEDNFVATVRLAGGVLASVAGSRATRSRSGPIELVGENGQLIGDHVLNTGILVQGAKVTPLPLPAPVPTVRAVLGDFLRAVSTGDEMPIPLEEGVRAIALIRACYTAADTQSTVTVERLECAG